MSGSILYPPHDAENDVAVLFIETSGCLPMCGHGTIGTITIGIEEGLILPKKEGVVRMETPAGLVTVQYSLGEDKNNKGRQKVRTVKLTNVTSYLDSADLVVECPGLGEIVFDVAFGGNFYAIVDVQSNFQGMENYPASQLVIWGRELRKKINEKYSFVHPEDPTIAGCSHILWTGSTRGIESTAANAVFYGEKAIDRSPCGTGTSARMAQWYERRLLKKGEEFVHESIIGSRFTGRIEEELVFHGKLAIVPSIEGWARIYGYNTIYINPDDDPFAFGFSVL
jgi:4-hydroxyproline epimerase